jgi:antitoxin component of RelBE/YafQ-DinJ toxin-antitoxin module
MTDRAGSKKPSDEAKKPLRDVLNVRLDDDLSREIERIAEVLGVSDSEAARTLLQYGIKVQRLLEADDLQRHYTLKVEPHKRYAAIEAKWAWYSDDDEDWMR